MIRTQKKEWKASSSFLKSPASNGFKLALCSEKEMGDIELPISVFVIPVTGNNFVDSLPYSQNFCQNDTLCCHLSQAQKDLQISVCPKNARLWPIRDGHLPHCHKAA